MHKKHDPGESPMLKPPAQPEDAAQDHKPKTNGVVSEIFANLWKFILLFFLCGFIFLGTCIPTGIANGLDSPHNDAALWCAVIAVMLSLLLALRLFRKSPRRRVLMIILLGIGIIFVVFIANSF